MSGKDFDMNSIGNSHIFGKLTTFAPDHFNEIFYSDCVSVGVLLLLLDDVEKTATYEIWQQHFGVYSTKISNVVEGLRLGSRLRILKQKVANTALADVMLGLRKMIDIVLDNAIFNKVRGTIEVILLSDESYRHITSESIRTSNSDIRKILKIPEEDHIELGDPFIWKKVCKRLENLDGSFKEEDHRNHFYRDRLVAQIGRADRARQSMVDGLTEGIDIVDEKMKESPKFAVKFFKNYRDVLSIDLLLCRIFALLHTPDSMTLFDTEEYQAEKKSRQKAVADPINTRCRVINREVKTSLFFFIYL